MTAFVIFATFALLALALMAARQRFFSFSAQRAQKYQPTGPSFDIRQHLAGDLESEGVIFGPDGHVASRFVAKMKGLWNGDTGTLAENFLYAGGGNQNRQWNLNVAEDGSITATAADVIGTATGVQCGSAVQLNYRIQLTESAGGHVLDVTDWMYLMENGNIINRSEMRKFGVRVAELVATIRPAA